MATVVTAILLTAVTTCTAQDVAAARLTGLNFPSTVDVTSGPAIVPVYYGATDDLSGVHYFSIDFQGPGLGCGGANAHAEGYPGNGLSVSDSVVFQLEQDSTPPGIYPVCQLSVCDAVWNCHAYTTSDLQGLGLPTEFTLTRTQDVVAPQLTALSFPNAADVT
ncbi:MAG: hypothetical protein H6Q33_3404, partial [Deltaproteobacteria bacterium]|nr:hypothetical protein [Deltaproteobacteria bacterium]